MKKFFGLGASLIFAVLLAGCVTETKTSFFTDFTAKNARSINTSYDIQLTSTDNSISKVYKLTDKVTAKVFYAISNTDWKYNDINAEELNDFVIITQENAKDVVAFIELVSNAYSKKERKGSDGVLYDIAVVRDYTYSEMTVDSITTSSGTVSGMQSSYSGTVGSGIVGHSNTYGFGSTSGREVTRSMKEFEEEDELIRIQLKTVENEDILLFAVAGYAEIVEPEDLRTLSNALSK